MKLGFRFNFSTDRPNTGILRKRLVNFLKLHELTAVEEESLSESMLTFGTGWT